MKPIELHDTKAKGDNRIYVMPSSIMFFHVIGEDTVINLEKYVLYVSETPEEILALIEGKKAKKTPTKQFVKPTVAEVKAYCDERKNGVDPNKFIDHYETKGWLVGRTKMKDWKACVRTWEQRDNNNGRGNGVESTNTDWLQ